MTKKKMTELVRDALLDTLDTVFDDEEISATATAVVDRLEREKCIDVDDDPVTLTDRYRWFGQKDE